MCSSFYIAVCGKMQDLQNKFITKCELLATIINHTKPLIIAKKSSFLDVQRFVGLTLFMWQKIGGNVNVFYNEKYHQKLNHF